MDNGAITDKGSMEVDTIHTEADLKVTSKDLADDD